MVAVVEKRKRKRGRSERAKKSLAFQKRKECLLRKTMELSVLCDVQACIVINDADGEVTMWPANERQALKIFQSSKSLNPTNTTPPDLLLPPVPSLLSDDPLDWEDSVLEYLLKDSELFVSNADSVSEKQGVSLTNSILDFQELMEKVDERLQAVTQRINFLESSSSSSSRECVDEKPSTSISVSEPDQSWKIATLVSATQSQTPFFDCFNELGFSEEEENLLSQLCFLEENDGFTELFPI